MGYTIDGELMLDDEAEWLLAIENEILTVGERLREHERKVRGGKAKL